jgi:hypothetical protein
MAAGCNWLTGLYYFLSVQRMAKHNDKPVGQNSPKPPVTPLGKELRKIREKIRRIDTWRGTSLLA